MTDRGRGHLLSTGGHPVRLATVLAVLLAVPVTMAAAQQPTAAPEFSGYRLGLRRADLPRGLPCLSGLVCEVADSVVVHLTGTIVTAIVMSTTIDDGRARTAAEQWEAFYRDWSASQFGPADSVWMSANRTQLRATWRRAPDWEATLSLAAHLGGRPYTYVVVRLACLTPACRQPPDRSPR